VKKVKTERGEVVRASFLIFLCIFNVFGVFARGERKKFFYAARKLLIFSFGFGILL